jgi:hypothetical protein
MLFSAVKVPGAHQWHFVSLFAVVGAATKFPASHLDTGAQLLDPVTAVNSFFLQFMQEG